MEPESLFGLALGITPPWYVKRAEFSAEDGRLDWSSSVGQEFNKSGSVPKVVEKGTGISYPIGKPNKNKGGHADEERIPQGTGIDLSLIHI